MRIRHSLNAHGTLAFIMTACLFIFVSAPVRLSVSGQTNCTAPPTNGKSRAWGQGAVVAVNMDPNFSVDQRNSITTAFNNWQGANGASGNSSGVTFTFTTNSQPISGTNSYQISQTTPSGSVCMSSLCQAETSFQTGVTVRTFAITNVNPLVTNLDALTEAMAHEIGHTFGLGDCDTCTSGTSVMTAAASMNDTTSGRPGPSACDNQAVQQNGGYQSAGGGGVPADCTACFDIIGCLECDSNQANCPCTLFNPYSPIILDVDRDGYDLTDLWGGVRFDLDVKGRPGFTAWTAAASDDAFLVLDRNGNGVIDDGRELFGNATPLGNGATAANGWDALAVFDQGDHGGNGDGLIDARDAIYSLLRLWQDLNHNGISEPEEVHKLPELGIDVITLDYQREGRRDRNGNLFRFRSRIQGHDQVTGKNYQSFAFDVFFGIPGHTSSTR